LLLLKRKFCSRVSRMELLSLVRLQLLLLFPGAEEAFVVMGCWSLRLLFSRWLHSVEAAAAGGEAVGWVSSG